jgi:hypothetical protein
MLERARETKILFVVLPQARFTQNVEESTGFWPNMDRIRGLSRFLQRAIKAYGRDNYELLSVDVAKYFGSIPEDGRRKIAASFWIPTPYRDYIVDNMCMPFYDTADGKLKLWPENKAASEGSVLLPIIANLYLYQTDTKLNTLGIIFCRYADNLCIALPKRSIKGLPWHGPAETFIQRVLQPNMPPGVTLHTLERPEKSHIIKGHLELGVYLDPHSTSLQAIMQYKQGESPHEPEDNDAPLKVTKHLPLTEKFTEEWHQSYPQQSLAQSAIYTEQYYNSGQELIYSVFTDVAEHAEGVRADPHEIVAATNRITKEEDLDKAFRELRSIVKSNKVCDRMDRAIERVEHHIRKYALHGFSPRQTVDYVLKSHLLTGTARYDYLLKVYQSKKHLEKVWKQELYGVHIVALS